MTHILCSLGPNYRIDQNYQVGKAFAFQSVAMNLGTLCWPVGLFLFVCLFFFLLAGRFSLFRLFVCFCLFVGREAFSSLFVFTNQSTA